MDSDTDTPSSDSDLPLRPGVAATQEQQHTYTLSDGNRFVLFGDSILQQSFSQNVSFAFGAALTDVYSRRLDVFNRGLSGYNTLQALRAQPLCLPMPEKASMRFLLIMFGANDSRIQNSPGGPDQYVRIEDFTSNLRHMVQHPCVKAHGEDVHIILVTTPPIDERKCLRADQEKYPTLGQTLRRTAANTALYAQAIRDLGEELQIPVLDIHRSMLAHAGHDHLTPPLPGSMDRPTNSTLQSFLIDGLHFSGEGYRLLYGELMTLIERYWPESMPDRLPLMLPAWDFQPAWKVDGEIQEPEWEDGGWSGPLRERGWVGAGVPSDRAVHGGVEEGEQMRLAWVWRLWPVRTCVRAIDGTGSGDGFSETGIIYEVDLGTSRK
ncbi:hypothetical protein LTR91_015983 [Friedmanniomyces endolithicus]|uniref:SGNH hydrolase-type esterase domain-containing protein n=1 Tax=Friedmanniomyces endolithicus TaxID=329885 RepID=A0AAN6QLE9_9PEZI|nr:hypothetical protein LTR94_009825 [Friedmanniomyces endolithicus]KAK0789789.1 hypothetical protein LTR75_012230 [Friedmanniomyces endolithicus]KAK0795857.1 hypothetical protein LTR38_008751 [Friedmanniomyces endolithicus]KAK0815856.1 hypothetical protein LTR59_000229 [Friedmanniomyces endolithicus]KAK0837642.1 hypothetical protein LTR03_012623 [Friedmanniomyces endolithicus]